jgi:NADPH-dependent F420 reductase
MTDTYKIAIVGGTGDLGSGLAKRWARAGHAIIIGSRDAGRAVDTAVQFNADAGTTSISGMDNGDAAAAGEIVVLTVPYENHAPTLDAIRDKVQG